MSLLQVAPLEMTTLAMSDRPERLSAGAAVPLGAARHQGGARHGSRHFLLAVRTPNVVTVY
jgi:hypothetical protein